MIDYRLLSNSQHFYKKCDYRTIESPWTVSDAVSKITRPEGLEPYMLKHNGKCLVGSGEQSFLYLMTKGFLPEGKYQTITPCFRDESFDTTHLKYFMKNELIDTQEVTEQRLQSMIHHALIFFAKYLPESYVYKTEQGYDIMWFKYELGSYGIRKHDQFEWIYGTGIAEPRLSTIMKIRNGVSQSTDHKR